MNKGIKWIIKIIIKERLYFNERNKIKMSNYKISNKRKIIVWIKENISRIVLFFLYRGIKVLYKKDSRVKEELDALKDGFTLELKTSINGPKLIVKKENNDIIKLKETENVDISICFKSIDAAFLVLTGRLGVAQAYAEHRFTLKGDIAVAMAVVRCVDLVESYLLPKFITKNILKEVPKREKSMLSIYRRIILNF